MAFPNSILRVISRPTIPLLIIIGVQITNQVRMRVQFQVQSQVQVLFKVAVGARALQVLSVLPVVEMTVLALKSRKDPHGFYLQPMNLIAHLINLASTEPVPSSTLQSCAVVVKGAVGRLHWHNERNGESFRASVLSHGSLHVLVVNAANDL